MKRLAILPIAAAMILATASPAFARADGYYTVVCDGVEYESVDAHAVEQGHKDDAVQRFMENTPFGLTCTLEPHLNP